MRLLLTLVLCLALVAPLHARPVQTAKLTVSSGPEDADQESPNSAVTTNGDQVNLQKAAAAFLFKNVQIQQGFAVHSASVSFYSASSNSNSAIINIQAELTCTPASYADNDKHWDWDKDKDKDDNDKGHGGDKDKDKDGVSGLAARLKTAHTVPWSTAWIKDRQYITADISALIQEVVDLPTWRAGDSISLIFSYGSGSNSRKAYSKEGAGWRPERVPALNLNYDAPAVCSAFVDSNGVVTTYTAGEYGHLFEGTRAHQTCASGYKGCDTELICTSDGTWSGTPVRCTLMTQGPDTGDMQKIFLANGNSGLFCNDGSSPMYYIRQSQSNKWVIQFEGGGLCYNGQSCGNRIGLTPFYVTSNQTNTVQPTFNNNPTRQGNGIFSRQDYNTYWKDANAVFVHYCSSDMWSGTRTAPLTFNPPTPFPFWFQGQFIATAVLEELGSKFDLGCASDIVLSGEAASGGVGITMNLNDRWLPQLRRIAPGAKVKVLSEGAWVIPPVNNIGDLSPTYQATPMNLKPASLAPPPAFFHTGQHIQNAQSVWLPTLPSHCVAAGYTNKQPVFVPNVPVPDPNVANEWKCYFLPYVFRYMAAPVFYVQAQFDAPMMSQSGLIANPVGSTVYPQPSQWDYIEQNLADPTELFLGPYLRLGDGAYSLRCIGHKLTGKIEFVTANYNGLNLQTAFQNWWEDDAPVSADQYKTIDDTQTDGTPTDGNTYASNPTCPVIWI